MTETVIAPLPAIFAAAISFVDARRKKSGGFGATPGLPATIEDTYHAVNILALIQRASGRREVPAYIADESLRFYLAGTRKSIPAGARTTFQLLHAGRIAGLEFGAAGVEQFVLALLKAATSLDEWYYCIRIVTEILQKETRGILTGMRIPDVVTQQWRTVDEAWMQLYLAQTLQISHFPPSGMIEWIQACQNGDGGFGFFPGTTSFVENCHYCLRALAVLRAKPDEPDKAYQFIAGSQTISGGFGRSYRAAPFLDTTWQAVAALAILCNSKSGDPKT